MNRLNLNRTLAGKPIGLLLGVVALVLFLAASAWWLLKPSYVPLYKDLPESAQADVLAILAQQQIAYRINDKEGGIEVAEAQLSRARTSLATAGVPAQSGKGYELFDTADYGMSEFAQKINYQRALEGELARTIMGLHEVKFARVHLTLKKGGLYISQQEQPKASVIVQLRQGPGLDRRQIFGIQQLVASSVEGLVPDAVVVLDEAGQALNGRTEAGGFDDRWQLATRIEGELEQKIQTLLEQTYGTNNARAAVRVQMNFDRVKAVKELPLAKDGGDDGVVVREKQSLSRTPGNDGADAGAGSREQNSNEVEYAVGKSHSEVEYATGKIERISVGIVLSNALANVDTQALDSLVRATVGLNAERGDRLSIAMLPMLAASQPAAAIKAMPAAAKAAAQAQEGRAPSDIAELLIYVLTPLVLVIVMLLVRRRQAKPLASSVQTPLLPAERERLLADLRQWLSESRREPS